MSKKVREGYNYRHISSATTTTVKSGQGVLKAIVINNQIANATTEIYDNTAGSGTLIAVIAAPAASAVKPLSIEYNVGFTTGLTLVTSAAESITVVYI